ncbi:hypothetical protein [Psychroserpens mesophilus]|uniref:hypothetical protein n=1 Tax=Psychroserpens mesophilus TaxID=325473 RepID=UPI003D656D46
MKKFLLLGVIMCSLWSCSPEKDDSLNFFYETLPVESASLPDVFEFGQIYEISMTYLKPSGCHLFNDFYYVSEDNLRTIAIINTVFPDQDCETYENEIEEVSINFQVNSFGPYVFRFWQGEDDNGTDTYYVVEVPVIE